MKKNDMLFDLIKSLNKNEKRYFKLFSSLQSGNKVYLKLFDAIQELEVYDETSLLGLLVHVDNGLHFPAKNFSDTKQYLYNQILKSMHAYRSESTADMKINRLLNDVAFLFEKGLYSQSKKKLTKAKKIAEKHEKYLHLITIIGWEKKIFASPINTGITYKNIKMLYQEEKNILKKINTINDYWLDYSTIFLFVDKHGYIRNNAEKRKLDKIINKIYAKGIEESMPYNVKIYYYNILFIYYYLINDELNMYLAQNKVVESIEKYNLYTQEDSKKYMAALHNLLIVCITIGKYDEFFLILNKLRKVSTEKTVLFKSSKLYYYLDSFFIELKMYVHRGYFQKGLSIVEDIKIKLNQFKEKVNKQDILAVIYNIAILYFGVCDYKNSLKWINKILNDKEIDVREDVYCSARIFNLIIHYELGNIDVLEYYSKSAHRYLNKKGRLYKFESKVLYFVNNILPNASNKKELITIFGTLRDELLLIAKNSHEAKALEYFDIISWVESKIENRPFADIVREKAENGE